MTRELRLVPGPSEHVYRVEPGPAPAPSTASAQPASK